MESNIVKLKKMEKQLSLNSAIIILGIIFVSFNLRAPITSIGPIISLVKKEYLLNNSMAGFITTLPLVIFALFSPCVSKISHRFGYGITMLGGLLLISAGELIRSYTNFFGLFLGTAVMGIGIAIGNVLLPSIIKHKFPNNVGLMTSVYTTSMCIFAAIGAGVSVPLTTTYGLTWRNSLGIWILLTLITIAVWLPQLRKIEESSNINRVDNQEKLKGKSIWKSKLAWWITLFMGIQSLLFYSLVAWLPSIIQSKGMSGEFAGSMALLFQLVGLPATLTIPIIAYRFKHQKLIAITISIIYLIGMFFLLLAETKFLIIISLIFLGLGMGGAISLSIAFISLRTPHAKKAAELSGMAQSAGYLLAALGPILIGGIFDITKSWNIPILMFIFFIVLLMYFGIKAGRDEVTHC